MTKLPPPRQGAVYGFNFVFPPKTHGEVHPGIVVAVKQLQAGKCVVIALPISHKEPRLHEPCIVVPMRERLHIGLDLQHQHVFYGYWGKFVLPAEVRKLGGLNRYCVGEASAEFFREVSDRWREEMRSR